MDIRVSEKKYLNVRCHMLLANAYVDPWDMLNNFCFHAYYYMNVRNLFNKKKSKEPQK